MSIAVPTIFILLKSMGSHLKMPDRLFLPFHTSEAFLFSKPVRSLLVSSELKSRILKNRLVFLFQYWCQMGLSLKLVNNLGGYNNIPVTKSFENIL